MNYDNKRKFLTYIFVRFIIQSANMADGLIDLYYHYQSLFKRDGTTIPWSIIDRRLF